MYIMCTHVMNMQRGEEPNENSTPGNLENNAVEEEYTSQITGQGDT